MFPVLGGKNTIIWCAGGVHLIVSIELIVHQLIFVVFLFKVNFCIQNFFLNSLHNWLNIWITDPMFHLEVEKQTGKYFKSRKIYVSISRCFSIFFFNFIWDYFFMTCWLDIFVFGAIWGGKKEMKTLSKFYFILKIK